MGSSMNRIAALLVTLLASSHAHAVEGRVIDAGGWVTHGTLFDDGFEGTVVVELPPGTGDLTNAAVELRRDGVLIPIEVEWFYVGLRVVERFDPERVFEPDYHPEHPIVPVATVFFSAELDAEIRPHDPEGPLTLALSAPDARVEARLERGLPVGFACGFGAGKLLVGGAAVLVTLIALVTLFVIRRRRRAAPAPMVAATLSL